MNCKVYFGNGVLLTRNSWINSCGRFIACRLRVQIHKLSIDFPIPGPPFTTLDSRLEKFRFVEGLERSVLMAPARMNGQRWRAKDQWLGRGLND